MHQHLSSLPKIKEIGKSEEIIPNITYEQHKMWVDEVSNSEEMKIKVEYDMKEGEEEMVYMISTEPQHYSVRRTKEYINTKNNFFFSFYCFLLFFFCSSCLLVYFSTSFSLLFHFFFLIFSFSFVLLFLLFTFFFLLLIIIIYIIIFRDVNSFLLELCKQFYSFPIPSCIISGITSGTKNDELKYKMLCKVISRYLNMLFNIPYFKTHTFCHLFLSLPNPTWRGLIKGTQITYSMIDLTYKNIMNTIENMKVVYYYYNYFLFI